MFLPLDADWVRRDSALPGLATLLDASAFVSRLRRALGREDLGTAQITYVKYDPGEKCLVGYQVQVGETQVPVHAICRSDAPKKLPKVRNQPGVPGPLGPGRLALEDCATIVSIFPNDRAVKGLPCLADEEARKRLLRECLPDRSDLWEGPLQCLAYKPERRYVASLRGKQGAEVVLRVYNQSGYSARRGNAHAFASRGPLRLSRELGRSDHQAVLAFEWLPGRVLSEILADAHLEPAVLAKVGAALAELHAQDTHGLARRTGEAEAASLSRVANALSLFHSHLAERGRDLARRLAAFLRDEPSWSCPIHGDFNATQVVLTGDAVGILDLDKAACGDPAIDLGNFLSYLERDALRGIISPTQLAPLRKELLDGYGYACHPYLLTRVQRHTAAGLFRRLNPFRYWEPHWRGPESFRCWEPHWPKRAEAILERVEKLVTAPAARG